MIRPNVLQALRRSRGPAQPDELQLSTTVVPLPSGSMRILEFGVACAALGVAVLLGLIR